MSKIFCIFDIETDGLLDELTKCHCVSYQLMNNGNITLKKTITDSKDIIELFKKEYVFVGHNIIGYDFLALKKLFNIDRPKEIIDTLGLSYYLFCLNPRHGLEYWGDCIGIEKPKIDDWNNLRIEDYIHRCQYDVMINTQIFIYFMTYIKGLYPNIKQAKRLINYINFKMECISEHNVNGIPLDIDKAKENFNTLEETINNKINILTEAMPNNLGKVIKTKPKRCFKNDGSLTKYGEIWFDYLSEHNLPLDSTEIKEEPNPQSLDQLKEWLYRLGWKPETFKEVKNKSGKKTVERITIPFSGKICPSVKKLYEIEPALKELEQLYLLKHRYNIFKGFLDTTKNGKVYMFAHGFTNTLRLTHSKPIVNLPKPGIPYGTEIRSCLYIPKSMRDKYIMCGCDLSSLEDTTKQHYIYPYDPQYVEDMRVPGFDPHIDIALLAHFITKDDEKFFKNYNSDISSEEDKERYSMIKKQRGKAKTTNFAATYNAQPPKIAKTAGISLKDATELFNIYWKRNWAIKEVEKSVQIKVIEHYAYVNGKSYIKKSMWIFNPVSNFWIYLKDRKDIFSSLNQSTGVYVFDTWLGYVRMMLKHYNIPVLLQYHDEFMFITPKKYKPICNKILKKSIKLLNKKIKLNVDIGNSADWGYDYAEVH